MNINLEPKSYDFLNSLVRYVLPAFGTLYFALSAIWGLPYAEEILGTIAALTAFLGLIIALARKGWKADDELIVDTRDPELLSFGFKTGRRFEEMHDGQILTLKLNKVEGDFGPVVEEEDLREDF